MSRIRRYLRNVEPVAAASGPSPPEPKLDPASLCHPESYGVPPRPGYRWSREPFIDHERGVMGARWMEVPDVEALARAREIQREAERELGIYISEPEHHE